MFEYQEILPGKELREHVKCYFIVRLKDDFEFSDVKYPSGQMEMVFNLGESAWESKMNNKTQVDPNVELLGQTTRPLLLKSPGKTLLLGIRFYSYAASYFLDHPLEDFNNQIVDLRDVMGQSMKALYEQLLNEQGMSARIQIVERFLFKGLSENTKNDKLILLKQIANDLHSNPERNIKHLAGRYNISTRNMQRLFLRYMGITPKLYGRINRFQQCIQLIDKNEASLTGVAYKFGYADQSHFIKDFKSFSDKTPSAYSSRALPF